MNGVNFRGIAFAMDSLAFLLTLGVAVLVIAWYVENEAKNAAGGIGVFAIGRTDAAAGAGRANNDAPRYRLRERLTLDRRGALRTGLPVRAYRFKTQDRPAWRPEASRNVEADEDY